MLNPMKLACSAVLVAALANTAVADPTDFDGTYYLACEAGSYTLHFDLWGEMDGQPVSHHPAIPPLVVPCEDDDPAIATILDQVEATCEQANLPAALCDGIENAVVSAIENTIGLIPLEISTEVTNADNWFAKLVGIFNMRVTHVFENGAVTESTYLINDQANSANGDFLSLSLALDGVGAVGVAGCAATTLGWIDGTIDRDAGYALEAGYNIDKSLTCGFTHDDDWLAGVIGVTFHADVSGERAQP